MEWAVEAAERGAGEILLTSMDRDGTKDGYDLELTRAVADAVPIPVIASGGVGTLDHLVEGIIEGGADAVLAASIFHYGRYSIAEAKRAMREAGIDVVRRRPPLPPLGFPASVLGVAVAVLLGLGAGFPPPCLGLPPAC